MRLPAILAGAALALAGAAVPAQQAPTVGDAQALRTQAMKNVGASVALGAAILKGEAPFEPRVAQALLATINSSALGFGLMFPEGSIGPDSKAKDNVLTDRAGFEAAVNKFIADSAAAVAAKPADMAAFQAQFGAVTANCRACHEVFRQPQN